ncbi:unnamed protein product [Cylicocyclus nassatus]|uniref:Uncharacterized protein n=1 Tax=Cylicocyclus nassatus TaxID=53992 RepID=A0AA36LYY5_CYLNA|nr:unnamed protein product [Cylicocyclus nassatus]
MLLLVLLTIILTAHSLTCYNGGRLLSTTAVGESVEECPPSAYCYNMTAKVAFFVDAIKTGCSTWRCMLARDTCITTTFQMIPVSFCCCSHDRCNVAENLAYGSIAEGNGRLGEGGKDSSNVDGNAGAWGGGNNDGANQDGYGDNTNDNNFNGWGKSNDGQSGNNGGNTGGWGRGDSRRTNNGYDDNNNNNYNGWGNKYDEKTTIYPRLPSDSGSRGSWWDPKQIKDKFNDFDVDNREDDAGGDEVFEKVDVRFTTRPPRRLPSYNKAPGISTGRQGSTGGEGREIELDV